VSRRTTCLPDHSGVSDETQAVHLSGEIDMSNADLITRIANLPIDYGRPVLTLDLSGVEFIDSQGLNALLRAHRDLDSRGGALMLCRVPEHVCRLFELGGVRQFFTIAD
jgi:anti-sigma B factor antagonist